MLLLHLLKIILRYFVTFLLITQWTHHIKCVEPDQKIYNTELQTPQTDVSFEDKRLLVKTYYKSPWNDSGMVQELHMSLPLEHDDMHIPSNGNIENQGEQQKDSPNGLGQIKFIWLLIKFLDVLFDLNFNTSNVEEWKALLKHYNDNVYKKHNQLAVAGIFIKNEEPKFFPICRPKFTKHPQHAEKELIQLIDDFLKDNLKTTTQIEGCILIYTYNSPCFKRNEPGVDTPCFFLISDKSYEWQKKYNLSTEAGFTSYWGPISRTMSKNFQQGYMETHLNVVIASYVMEHPKLILGSNCHLKCFFINNEAKDQFGITN